MPPTSIAARLTFRDDRDTPLLPRRVARKDGPDLPDAPSGIFAQNGLAAAIELKELDK
jgi:hypothetical protein